MTAGIPLSDLQKVDYNGFYEFPDAVISGNTVTLTLTDGGSGDTDWLMDAVITDPGGIATPVSLPQSSSGGGGGCAVSQKNVHMMDGVGSYGLLIAAILWLALKKRRRC